MKIPMQQVQSSQISAVGYDEATSTLSIQFAKGNVYHYAAVPKVMYERLIGAESIGKFFYAHIKGHFAYERQPEEPADETPAPGDAS